MLMTFRLDWSTSMQHLPSLKIPLADPMPLSQLHVLHWKDTETGIRCMLPGEIPALCNNMSNLTQKHLGRGMFSSIHHTVVDRIEMRKTDCFGKTRLVPHIPSSS